MKLEDITFESYKSFPAKERLKLKPITFVIGKNSSGKSAFSRIPLLLSNSFTRESEEPIMINHNGVEFGGSFADLVYNRLVRGNIKFEMKFEADTVIQFEIQGVNRGLPPIIKHWGITSPMLNLDLEIELTEQNLGKTTDITYNNGDEIYLITFQGLFPSAISTKGKDIDFRVLDLLSEQLFNFSKNVSYTGPYRQVPQRVYFHSGKSLTRLGVRGEYAPQILGNAMAKNDGLVKSVGDWYEKYLGGWRIDVQQIEEFFQLVLLRPDNEDVKVNIVDVGQGMIQVLPLVVQCMLTDRQIGCINIVEQPELHLHPAAHGDLAELFANAAKKQKGVYVLETHSENMILRIRRMIVEGNLSPDDVIIYWIDQSENSGSTVKEITINDAGEISDWPPGVFSEDYEEVLAIREAQKKKHAADDKP